MEFKVDYKIIADDGRLVDVTELQDDYKLVDFDDDLDDAGSWAIRELQRQKEEYVGLDLSCLDQFK